MGKDKRVTKKNVEISKRDQDIITALRLQKISLKLTIVQIDGLIEGIQKGEKISLPDDLSEWDAMGSFVENE